MSTKTGVLTTVAATGGLKLDGVDVWINPHQDIKKMLQSGELRLDALKGLKGKRVALDIEDSQGTWYGYGTPAGEDTSSLPEEKGSVPETPKEETGYLIKGVDSYFTDLNKIKLVMEKKGDKLNYVSWAEAWNTAKKLHPEVDYRIHLNRDESPLFKAGTGGMVKVSVVMQGDDKELFSHTVMLPVMDNSNHSVPMENIDSFGVNKTIQRALVKCLAMHGLGLYVFMGENNPEKEE
jgi:hypothetical protein